MSEFYVKVVEIEKVENHPNADRLDILTVLNGYPVIAKRDEYKVGNKAVYVSVDALVPVQDARWSFLTDSLTKEYQRIKAKRLRGVFSMGILTAANDDWEVGQDVQELLNIKKWEPEVDSLSTGGLSVVGPSVPVYDLEGLRKFQWSIPENEEVVLTEKIHGANARFLVDSEGVLWVGSRTQFKKEDPNNMWWKVAEKYNLKEKLSKYPGYTFYGEVYGQVQDLKYGATQGEAFFRLFDVWLGNTWADYDSMLKLASELELQTVPELYRGPWSSTLLSHAEGNSTLANHVREGFVLSSVTEKWNGKGGRLKYKMVGEGYHLRKE
jgi:RNA ligase (TIGR02306 family)